jgi:bifunctional non-homologous end joining protein LigD
MTVRTGKLTEYRRKRDFSRTREPEGGKRAKSSRLAYVIQKHDASRLHFDLRLELDGVMKSWAVPKGPSLDPSVKRLAIHVEDHPIEYNEFEGTIPEAEYGGGTVMVWDHGTYTSADETSDPEAALREGYRKGDLKVLLRGERLKGSWVLVRTRGWGAAKNRKNQWLLIKHRDDAADPDADPVAEQVTSARTGRTMEEIAEGKPAKRSRKRRIRR